MKKLNINESMLNHHIERVVSKHLNEQKENTIPNVVRRNLMESMWAGDRSPKEQVINKLVAAKRHLETVISYMGHPDAEYAAGEDTRLMQSAEELAGMAGDLHQYVISELGWKGRDIPKGYTKDHKGGINLTSIQRRPENMNENK